ncbi:TonB-dependent receptor [Prolixibacter sp. NT017]|uniref:SusC/RagA family TonB-linked outer membrane protein n=1 Tax=Prolixibacter sp. NT017 TaxID=2652390 RepID=UPI0012727986|nr:TonB-dependent receptor [Prolixibacter sp. NT017]GET25627.1 SusC/RagA family TonB-linked outer membrane protein [Prolixibacter sp. NT017]
MKKTKLKLLVLAIFFGISLNTFAQAQQISGVVYDEHNNTIPGVTVVEKGTTNGTVTNSDGKFNLTLTGKSKLLDFSFVGYKTQQVPITNQTTYAVHLVPSIVNLDEVVAIGYGSVKKGNLTGAVNSVDHQRLEKANKVDAISALEGQSAGVVIQRTDNKPGSGGFNIRIRGASTINTNETASQGGYNPGQNPLFIVDGIAVDDISFLNPSDIERMDILKDASATAIYGSRGSSGVVLIQTKQGRKGKLRVSYNNYFGFKQAYHLPKMLNTDEYVQYLKDDVVGNHYASGDYNFTTADVVLSDYLDPEELQNIADGVNTDWVKLIRVNGYQTNHTLNLSGGNDKTVYSASMGYTKDNGTVRGENFTRYNVKADLSSDILSWLNLSIGSYMTYAIQNTGSWEAFRSAYRLKPIGRPYNADGSLRFYPLSKETQVTNPLFEPSNITKQTKYLQWLGNIAIKLTPVKNLTLTSKFSPNIKFTRYGEYRGLHSKSVSGNPSNRRAQVNNFNYLSYTWDNIINYKFKKGIHDFNITAVMSRYMENNESYYTQVRNFTTDNYLFHNLGAGLSIRDVSSGYSEQTLESYTGRINYALNDKYLFTFTGRYDGSSILADNNKWAFFPSASFAWKLLDEGFMKNQKVLSSAKFRLSIGQTGNNGEGGGLAPLGSQSLLGSSATNLGGTSVSTAYVTGLANKDLTWEKTTEENVGFDYGFLNNRVFGSIDVYHRKTTGIIFFTPLPSVTGFSGTYNNVGESSNNGVEISLNTVNVDNGNFKWTTNFNFASNKNKIDKLYGNLDEIQFNVQGTNLINKVGEPIGSIYDYVYDGIWQSNQAAEAAKYGQKPGQVRVKDLNGDGHITPGKDRKVIGQVTPKWTGGMTSSMNYKNFDFSFSVITSQGNKISSTFYSNTVFPYDENPSRLFNAAKVNYWTPNNPTNDWYQPGNGGPYSWVSKYKDISYTKIGYITLGYKIPDDILKRAHIAGLRVYTTVQNPFIFTNYGGWDPENAGRNSWGEAFMSRTYMAGINLSF